MTSDTAWLGSMPETYDRCLGPALFAPFAAHLAGLAAVDAPVRVLELAAGTGVATAELVRALPDATITATDLNPAMVAWGRERVPGATWQPADAGALPQPDASVELVVCQFGAMFFPDRSGAFAEARRVLAAGRRFLLTTWQAVEASPFPAALTDALDATLPDDPPTFVARVPHGYHDPAQVEADLAAAGFDDVTVERVVLTGEAPSARTLAEGFCLGTPLRFALEQRGDLGALCAAVGDHMTATLGDGPVEGDLAALVVTAR
jgi:ubiquinone/menaquinone biosynthesis C-methylase UbiE